MISRNRLFAVLRSVVADFASVEKIFVDQGEDVSDVKKYLKMFKELRDGQKIKEIEDKNIDNWGKKPFSDLIEFVDSLQNLPTEIRQLRQKKIKGAKLVAENKDWFVYEVSEYDASKHLTEGAGWCIKHESHWLNYTEGKGDNRPSDFYFLISKTRSNDRTAGDPPLYVDKWKKIALQVFENGKKLYWDVPDKSHNELPPEVASTVPEFTPVFSGRIKINNHLFRCDTLKEIPANSKIDKLDSKTLKSLKSLKEIPENIEVGTLDLRDTTVEKIPKLTCNKLFLNFPECKVKELPEGIKINELYLDNSPDIKLPENLSLDKLSLTGSEISELPKNLIITALGLNLSKTKIKELPEKLSVNSLHLNNLVQKIPKDTTVTHHLDLSESDNVEIPEGFSVRSICWGISKVSKLPTGFKVTDDNLDLSTSNITELPERLVVGGELKLPKGVKTLPEWLQADSLNLQNSEIKELPWNLKVSSLNINNTKIKELPIQVSFRVLSLRNTPIEKLPPELKEVGFLDIRGTGIENLSELKEVDTVYLNDKVHTLPPGLEVGKRIYVKENQLKEIPENMASKVVEIY